jgi:hypothetical protein
MTSLTHRRGEHQARRAATNNNHFSFVGQHYFSFNRLSSSVVRSARARIRLWTVRVVSRASSRMPLPDPCQTTAHRACATTARVAARARRSATGQVRWPVADATLALTAEIWREVFAEPQRVRIAGRTGPGVLVNPTESDGPPNRPLSPHRQRPDTTRSHAHGKTVVPSPWQATSCLVGSASFSVAKRIISRHPDECFRCGCGGGVLLRRASLVREPLNSRVA